MKLIAAMILLLGANAVRAEAIWIPKYTCENGTFEIDYLELDGNEESEEQAVIHDPAAISYIQSLVDTKLELGPQGEIVIAGSASGFKGNVDGDLVHKRVTPQNITIYQVHGHPVRSDFDLSVTSMVCAPDCTPKPPGAFLGHVLFKNCVAL